MPAQTTIPTLIHQTWKDSDIPPTWRTWADSWRRHNPGWGYRLWTDADNREFLEEHYSWFLPVYDGYPEPIMRADAVRYFLMDHFGGLYVDLDFECLKPVQDILEGRELVLGCEPEAHTRLLLARQRNLDRIVGNAFIASRPGHPFWAHAHRQLVAAHRMPSALDATGPFWLTRTIASAPDSGSITVLGSEVLYPAPSPYVTQLSGPPDVDRERAHALHHWSGSWTPDSSWTPRRSSAVRRVRFWASQGLQPFADGAFDLDAQRRSWAAGAPAPTVSCLMVTKDRPSLAARAIACFRAQTYPNTELVVIDDSSDDALERRIGALDDPRIRLHRLPPDGQPLGELRNIAVDRAGGAFVSQWDDDDLYDPERLEVQMAAILALGAEACFLTRERLWWPARRRIATSRARLWEGSMVCAREKLSRYPAQRRGEDTPVAEQVVRTSRVVSVDVPELYTYVFHENNTFDAAHFGRHFEVATDVSDGGSAYAERLLAMARRLPIAAEDLVHAETAPAPAPPKRRTPAGPAPEPAAERPPVLVLTPVKDATAFLPGYLKNLASLDYPRELVSLGLLEGDSRDGTWEMLQEALPELRARYRHVTVVRQDFGVVSAGPRWSTGIQRRRRSVLARARNHLLARALADEEWVLWLDVDVAAYPPDLVQRLLGAGKDIVVPHCVTEPAGPTYDLNTFVVRPGAGALNWSQWMRDGILQPPRGFGRTYLEDVREQQLIRVDSVGGTALLIRADLHRDGLVFPPVPYRRLIETEGLAALARDMGTACWALPALEVVHPHRASDVPGAPVPASRPQASGLQESTSEHAAPRDRTR
ncbi:glycosyltransferase [Streptomyces meridianus]|uniref:Glycosyltransferase n=1 Tax=Streptomyces meridianus TaxID=2938945 RepID=A0ABT0XDP7_9ACTN|nr:glycosyltransferase [Streptomyces meridianus]MCM2580520.1 glycosyltransferase [Streptomyces meridianus]